MAKRELKNVNVDEPIVDAVEETTEVVEEKIEESVEKVTVATGVVVKCSKLNIRKKSNVKADVACVVNAGAKLTVDLAKSNDEWLKVTTSDNVKGYCMKKFVSIDQ